MARKGTCGTPGPPYLSSGYEGDITTTATGVKTHHHHTKTHHQDTFLNSPDKLLKVHVLQKSAKTAALISRCIFGLHRCRTLDGMRRLLPAFLLLAGMCIYPGAPLSSLRATWIFSARPRVRGGKTLKASSYNEREGWRSERLIIHGATHWMAPP